jgi:hypothetical protein
VSRREKWDAVQAAAAELSWTAETLVRSVHAVEEVATSAHRMNADGSALAIAEAADVEMLIRLVDHIDEAAQNGTARTTGTVAKLRRAVRDLVSVDASEEPELDEQLTRVENNLAESRAHLERIVGVLDERDARRSA